MKPVSEGLDPILFAKRASWDRRLAAWQNREESDSASPFLNANADAVSKILRDEDNGLRMVINIPAEALLSFLAEDRYRNAYDLPVVAGKRREPSEDRKQVDAWLGLGEKADEYYFGAASLGGTGVRFYGEYCMVLRREKVPKSTRVFDRNSYDLLRPPLRDSDDMDSLARCLGGSWSADAVAMLALKVLPQLRGIARLLTAGVLADSVLQDEDFLEVQKRGSIKVTAIEEVRQSPEDVVRHMEVLNRYSDGGLPTPEELLWTARRQRVEEKLAACELSLNTVSHSGRSTRWR